MIYNPVLYDENGQGTDVLSLNLKNRNVFLVGEINDEMAASIISQLLYLDSVKSGKSIWEEKRKPYFCAVATKSF